MRILSLVIVLASITVGQSAEAQDRGIVFFREVLKIGQSCAAGKSGTEFFSCYEKASPKKCASLVYQALTQDDTAAWVYCVASCVDAGFWSSNFGECKRELK